MLPFSWRWPEDKEIHMKLGPSCEVLTKEILISSDLHISCTSLTIGNSIFLPVKLEHYVSKVDHSLNNGEIDVDCDVAIDGDASSTNTIPILHRKSK